MIGRKAVVFDWGGVLMRTTNYTYRHRWDLRLGLAEGEVEKIVHGIPEWLRAQACSMPLDDYWKRVGNLLGLPPDDLNQLRSDFYRGDTLNAELIPWIKHLRKRGVAIGLLSNNTLDLIEVIQKTQVISLLDAIVISAQIGVLKPSIEAYTAILTALNISADHVLFVDDFAENVDGARRAGISAILFDPQIDIRIQAEQWLNQ